MLRNTLERYAKKFLLLKHAARWYYSRTGYYNWRVVLEKDHHWQDALGKAQKGPGILIATSIGFHLPSVTMESLLAVALTLRNARVHFLLCDAALPACMACEIGWYPDQRKFVENGPSKFFCKNCFGPAHTMFQSLGLETHRYSAFLTPENREQAKNLSSSIPFDEIGKFALDGCAVGEHALAGALRFFARGTLQGEPSAEPVLRRYFNAALLSVFAMGNLLRKHNFQTAVFNHGIYVPQGLIGEVCRRENVRVVNWNPAYRKKCFIFSHHETYHHTMSTEPVEKWKDIHWNQKLDNKLTDYLKSRWKGTYDWIKFHKEPNSKLSEIVKTLGLDPSKPCVGLLTSVVWDAVLHYPSNAFPSMSDWIMETIRYFSRREDLQLIIRVHPAEIHGALPSRQRVVDEVKKLFGNLPENIKIIPPESNISTYLMMLNCDAALIYNTKTGIELAAMGLPIVVAGEAWIRNKGFSISVEKPDEYFAILDKLPFRERIPDEDSERAKKYAYHFFFRRMIPLECIRPHKGWPPYKIELTGLQDLMPGSSRGLDIICDGILQGTDFIYPDKWE